MKHVQVVRNAGQDIVITNNAHVDMAMNSMMTALNVVCI